MRCTATRSSFTGQQQKNSIFYIKMYLYLYFRYFVANVGCCVLSRELEWILMDANCELRTAHYSLGRLNTNEITTNRDQQWETDGK